jgi:Spy/CpxP family protein refolding chaperone
MTSRIASAVLAVALFALGAMAQNRPMVERPERMIQQLALNDEQQKQFDALASEFRKESVDRRAEIAKARIELMDLLKAESPDQGKITNQLEKIGALESAAKANGLDHWFQVNKILTPEQQKMWKKTLIRIARGSMADRRMREGRQGFPRNRQFERPEPSPR